MDMYEDPATWVPERVRPRLQLALRCVGTVLLVPVYSAFWLTAVVVLLVVLLAAAVLRALTEQTQDGGSRFVRVALARTAEWLTNGIPTGTAGDKGPYDPAPWLAERDSRIGCLRYALPPVSFEGGPTDWARPPGPWGTDPAQWG